MLLLWEKEHVRYDDDDEEVFYKKPQGIVVPDCCEAVQKSLAVVLHYDWRDMTDAQAYTKAPPPPEGADWKAKVNHMVNNVGKAIEGKTRFEVAKPRWKTGMAVDFHTGHAAHSSDWKHDEFQVEFCPYCGTKLPDIEPREDIPGDTHVPVADGDYCGTCDNRSRECTCMYPTVAWQTVKP